MKSETFTAIANQVVDRFTANDDRVTIHVTTIDRESRALLTHRKFFEKFSIEEGKAYSFDCDFATAKDTFMDEEGNPQNYKSDNWHVRSIRVENTQLALYAMQLDAKAESTAKYTAKYAAKYATPKIEE